MNLPGDFWTALGTIVAAIVAIAGGANWLLTRRGKASNTAQNEPKVTVEVHTGAIFPGYATVRAGTIHHALKPPSPWLKPIPLLVATVKNEDVIPIPLSKAGIRLERTGDLMELRSDEVDEAYGSLRFPFVLPSRESFHINIQPILIKRMLGVLEANPDDEFRVWVEERIEKRYFSPVQRALEYFADTIPLEVAIRFENLITQEQIGEEEYFPEGPRLPQTPSSSVEDDPH